MTRNPVRESTKQPEFDVLDDVRGILTRSSIDLMAMIDRSDIGVVVRDENLALLFNRRFLVSTMHK